MRLFGGGGHLRHQRLQTVLTIAAIATAVALPVVLLGVGGGVSSHELSNLQNSGYQIVISASGLHGVANAHALVHRLLRLPGVAAASPVLSIAIDAFPGTGAVPALAEGVIPDQFPPTLGPTEAGLFPSPLPLGDPTDEVHYDNGSYAGAPTYDVLVSSPFAQAYHLSIGSSLRLAPYANASQAVPYSITGIFGVPLGTLGQTGAFALLVPLSDLQVMTGYANGSGTPVVDAADSVEIAASGSAATDPTALATLQSEIQAIVPYYTVSTLSQQAAQLQTAASVLTGFYLALSSVGLTVGLVFLALVLLRRVESDRRSIGIRRAIGLPDRAVVAPVVVEGLVIAAIGAGTGIAGGILLVDGMATWGSGAVQEAAQLALFAPTSMAELAAGVLLLALVAGGLAARSALRMDLLEALR